MSMESGRIKRKNFEKVNLSEICNISIGRTPSRSEPSYWGVGSKWASIRDMKHKYLTDTKEEITDKAIEAIKLKKVKKGILLFSFKLTIGKMAFAGCDLYTNEAIAAFEPRDKKIVDSEYLYFALQGIKFSGKNQAVMGQTLNLKTLSEIPIPLTDISTQRQIVYILSLVEKLVAERKTRLQQLDMLLKSVFLDMFQGGNSFNADWPLVEIKSLAATSKNSMRTGPFGSNLLHSEFSETGDVAVLGIDNAVKNRFTWDERRYITNSKYSELKNYKIYPEDVIITIMGTTGRSAVVPKDIPLAINTKHLAAITLNREVSNPYFISYSFHSDPYIINQIKSRDRGAIMSGLNLGIIKSLKIRRPPIDLQNKFADILQHVDLIRFQYQSSLAELENLYGVLSQRAFKGELDLSRVPLQESEPEAVPFENGLPDLPDIVADLNEFNTGIQAIGPELAALRASSAQMEVMNLLLEVSSPAEQWQRLPRVIAALQGDASTQDMPTVAGALAAGQAALDKAQGSQIIALPGAEKAFHAMQQTFNDAQQQFPLYLGHTGNSEPTQALQEDQPVSEGSADQDNEAIHVPVMFTKEQVLEAMGKMQARVLLKESAGMLTIKELFSTEEILRHIAPAAEIQMKSYESFKSAVYELLDSGELVQILNKETKVLELRLRQ